MALRGTLTHWKTRLLAQSLGMMPCQALGVLEALWHTTAELAPAGNIGRLPNHAIAMEMFFFADADQLIAALIESGHLEEHQEHRLIVHDWIQHADYNTKRKVERRGELMIANGERQRIVTGHDASSQVITHHKSIPVPEPVPEPEPKRQKPKPRDAQHFVLPDWIDRDAWAGYEEMRASIRKKPTDRARALIVSKLEAMRNEGHDPSDALRRSTMNNWVDVYPPTNPQRPAPPSPPTIKYADLEALNAR
jgi:hypothetical protein